MSADFDFVAMALHFATLSLISISGAIATAPEMHRFLVDERHWMTHVQFTDSIAMAQAAPGPNVLFVGLFGYQMAGWSGALVALASMVIPSSVLVYATWRWKRSREETRLVKALRLGLSPIAAGLTIATGLILIRTAAIPADGGSFDWWLAVIAVVAVYFSLRTKRNPLWMIGLGAVAGVSITLMSR